jgi:hypothetical protein
MPVVLTFLAPFRPATDGAASVVAAQAWASANLYMVRSFELSQEIIHLPGNSL